MSVYLGVDGGGTKTEFVCIDEAGRELARAATGGTYHPEVGLDEVLRRLGAGLTALGIDRAAIDHAFFGLPAYGEDRVIDPRLNEACGRLLGHDRYLCGNDMVCGWAGSLACEDGINIVAGTGSIAYGERGGRTARAGGWGEVFGDEGSAYWIAREGLAAFARMSDGRLAAGPLLRSVRVTFSLASDLDLCAEVMGPPAMSRADVAALAPLVAEAAEEGDAAAAAILQGAADHLAAHARALRRTLGFDAGEPTLLSWSGSILGRVAPVRRAITRALEAEGFRFVEPRHSPAHGAALYARLRA